MPEHRARRRETDPPLRNPEHCPRPGCAGMKTHVIETRDVDSGWIRRRHQCSRCKLRWASWQSLIDPKDVDADVIDPTALKQYPYSTR